MHGKTLYNCIAAIAMILLNCCCWCEKITCGKANSGANSSNTTDLFGEVATDVYVLTTKHIRINLKSNNILFQF